MGDPFQQDQDGVFVVGPVRRRDRWVFLCPLCDDDVIEDIADAPPAEQCTTAWLRGRDMSWDERTWECFNNPFDGEAAASKRKRYFSYRAIARELQATGRRVELPGCVQAEINDRFEESEVGFVPDAACSEALSASRRGRRGSRSGARLD